MARTYTDIPEPRKVLEADTIRGYSRETVEEALQGGGGGGGNTIVMYADITDVQGSISDPTQKFHLYTDINLTEGYESLEDIPSDGYFVCKPVMSGAVVATFYPIFFSGNNVTYSVMDENQSLTVITGNLIIPVG